MKTNFHFTVDIQINYWKEIVEQQQINKYKNANIDGM